MVLLLPAMTNLFLKFNIQVHLCLCRRRVVQIFARGARILDGSYMTQELIFNQNNSDIIPASELPAAAFVSIADPYVLIRMTDGAIQLLVGGT